MFLIKISQFLLSLLFFVTFVYVIPSLVNYRSNMTSLLSRVAASEQNLFFFFIEFVLNLLASTGIFRTKSKLIFHFCLYIRFSF